MDPQITYIGKADFRNALTKFGIKPEDRTKHMYIIGKTGTGKSTFLENLIVQDIQNGNGLAFIDPHGSSAEALLDHIPEWRLDDVIYFNPSDMEWPIAFNPLEDPGPEKRHLVSDGLMSVFKKVWPEAFSGRMEYILNTTMMSLLEYPDSTVLSINRMLTDKDFRKRVVASVTDSAVKNAWDELMKWDDKRWSEAVSALINKVGQFSTNPVIRNIVGQPKSTFDFRKAMDERKIIIINLSKGMIGEQNAPLLGAMLITKIYLSAMSRAELPNHVLKQVAPFYFYVDEFQNFANESFASILSEARKYKLCLTIANQFIAQMEEPIRDAVFGNMGTTVAFRVGTLDAEFMEKVFAPVFTQDDLQSIIFRQFYITLQIDGMGSKPFSAQSLDMIPRLQTSMKNRVIEMSRKNFARPREEVEEYVREFFGYAKKDGAKVIHSEVVTSSAPSQAAPAYTPRPAYNTPPSTALRSNPAPQARPAASQAPRPLPPRVAPATVTPKPLAPVTGYRNEPKPVPRIPTATVAPAPIQVRAPMTATVPASKPEPRQAAPVPAPVKNSNTLNDLLGKLDDISVPDPTPTLPLAREGAEQKPKPIPEFVPKASPVSVPKTLDRAASPEKKSALAEALAKAMGAKSEKPKEEVPKLEQPAEPKPAEFTVFKPQQIQETKPEPIPESKPEPVIIPENKKEETIFVPEAVPVPTPIPEPTPSTYTRSATVREVPEDILRKVLE
ncbi:MAG: hypothetical protein JWM20_712 [Patescibacteria group bacterium]|nr:hypothetical protein [Patescibacteria group bacterium]